MAERLTGARVNGLQAAVESIFWRILIPGETLLIHLGMSGPDDGVRRSAWGNSCMSILKQRSMTTWCLDMDNGARITFNDPRRFGAMDLLETATAESHKLLAVLGPEPLGQ